MQSTIFKLDFKCFHFSSRWRSNLKTDKVESPSQGQVNEKKKFSFFLHLHLLVLRFHSKIDNVDSILQGQVKRNKSQYWPLDAPRGGFSTGLTDPRTDGRTVGRMDTPTYRDAKTYLKRILTNEGKHEAITDYSMRLFCVFEV